MFVGGTLQGVLNESSISFQSEIKEYSILTLLSL